MAMFNSKLLVYQWGITEFAGNPAHSPRLIHNLHGENLIFRQLLWVFEAIHNAEAVQKLFLGHSIGLVEGVSLQGNPDISIV